jgi:hypothetical protein
MAIPIEGHTPTQAPDTEADPFACIQSQLIHNHLLSLNLMPLALPEAAPIFYLAWLWPLRVWVVMSPG